MKQLSIITATAIVILLLLCLALTISAPRIASGSIGDMPAQTGMVATKTPPPLPATKTPPPLPTSTPVDVEFLPIVTKGE